jgi:hypothetical protein
MGERPEEAPADVTYLPTAGTPERLEWDLTIREVIELYPDWSAITVGKARFRREAYEKGYKDYYEGAKDRSPAGAPREARRPPRRAPRPGPSGSGLAKVPMGDSKPPPGG